MAGLIKSETLQTLTLFVVLLGDIGSLNRMIMIIATMQWSILTTKMNK